MNVLFIASLFPLAGFAAWVPLLGLQIKSMDIKAIGYELNEHIFALDSLLRDETVPDIDKNISINISDHACEPKTARDFLRIVEDVVHSKPPQSKGLSAMDSNTAVRVMAVLNSAIKVASALSGRSNKYASRLIDGFIESPARNEQMIYKFDKAHAFSDSRRNQTI